MINFQNVATSIVTGLVIWVGSTLLSSFQEVKRRYDTDRLTLQMMVPIVKKLHDSDSIQNVQLNDQHTSMEIIKESQKDIKDDVKEVKGLVITIVRQTKE